MYINTIFSCSTSMKKKFAFSVLFMVTLYIFYKPTPARHFYFPKKLNCSNENEINNKSAISLKLFRARLEILNGYILVRNSEMHGPVLAETPIIVIQVHRDIERLQYLIVSLAQVQDINTALLIFSHSYYDKCINELIKSIDFCKVTQIYFSYSVQQYPNYFPGVDPSDCNESETWRYKNLKPKCARDAQETEHKQHWWWKAKFVFDSFPWSKFHLGPKVFLEEHHYVAPDLLFMLKYALRAMADFPDAEILSFGKKSFKYTSANLLMVEDWRPALENCLVFNNTFWVKMQEYANLYCMFNDTRWSYSLWNMFSQFPRGRVNTITVMSPRVFSTSGHTDLVVKVEMMANFMKKVRYFPKTVKVVPMYNVQVKTEGMWNFSGSGGWSDIRDMMLCLGYQDMKSNHLKEDNVTNDESESERFVFNISEDIAVESVTLDSD